MEQTRIINAFSPVFISGWEFKKPGAPLTLVAKDSKSGAALGQRWSPTLMDMYEINSLYDCWSLIGKVKNIKKKETRSNLFIITV